MASVYPLRVRRTLLLLACAAALPGCRTTYKVAKGTTRLAVGTAVFAGKTAYKTTKFAAGLVKDMAYYTARKAFYSKQHDAKRLDSSQLGRVRRGRGKYERLPAYAGGWHWPLSAGIVSSEFGKRWGKRHEGMDIAADADEPVFAAADGQVEYAGDGLRGYGNVVILRHDKDTTSLYAHNNRLDVHEGDLVKGGQKIALLGSTGASTGPHVHFEIRKNQIASDPRAILPKSRF
jgi:murein DD-endopeptidase MepM/ murein hydrolase activator NlpD